MRIIKLKAENIKRLTAVEIEPNGNVVKITGKNANGKTSVLDAIYWAMSGTRNIQDVPIHEGANKASIKLELGELTVERKFSSKGTTLRVTKPTGAPMTSPQSVLDELIGNLAFDPLEFSRLPAKQQFEMLREIVVIDGDIDVLDEERAGVFLQRTDANRQLKALVVERDSLHFPEISKTQKDEVDQSALIEKINLAVKRGQAIKAIEGDRGQLERGMAELTSNIELIKENLLDSESRLFNAQEKIKTTEAAMKEKGKAPDIEALQLELSNAIEHRQVVNNMAADIESSERVSAILESETEKLKQSVIDRESQLSNAQENIKRFNATLKEKGEAPDIEALQLALGEAENINILVRKKQAFNDKKTSVDMTEKEVERLCERLDEIDAEKASLMTSATFPVDGLSFDDGVVLFNNLPFEQASSAEQLRVSMAMAMASNPDFRVIRITDGSLMDSDSFKIIEEMADKNDFQVWVEVVDESGDIGIVIEDGMVKKVN